MKNGDVLMKVGDQKVQDAEHFLALVGAKKPGETVTIHVMRDGKEQTLTATLGDSPYSQSEPRLRQGYDRSPGRRVDRRPEDPPQRHDRSRRDCDGSDAGFTGRQSRPERDDVITSIDGTPVKTPEELHKAIQSAGAGKEITIELFRGKEKMSLKATPKEG